MAKNKATGRQTSGATTIFDQISGNIAALVVIIATVLVVYGQNMSFAIGKFDEDVIILFNQNILRNPDNAIEVLKRDAFFNNPGRNFYRPVQNLSYFIDTQIGKGKSWAYYFTNILLHIATCWLLFKTLKDFGFRPGVSLASALLYATSPLFVHAIAWAPGRGDLLIALFALVCLRATFRYLDTRKISSLLLLHGCFFLSMFSKETSVLFPLMIAIAWWFFYPRRDETKKTLALTLLPCLIPIALFFITRKMVIPKFPAATVFGIGPFLSNLRVIPESIGKFIVPVGLAPLPAFTWLVTGLGAAIAVGLVVLALRMADEGYRKYIVFGLAWFLLFTIPGTAYTNELGDIAYDYLEHRAYLPMMGIVMVIGVILANLMQGARRSQVALILSAVILAFGAFSFVHARNYKNPELFYNMAVKGNPHSGMSLLNRGYLKATKGDINGAIQDYTRAGEECPTYAEAFVNRGVLYQNMRRMTEAGNDFKKAVKINTELFAAHYNMANWYSQVDDMPNALHHYQESMRLRPTFAEGWAMIASIKSKQGNLAEALPLFEKALSLDPNLMIGYINRGKALYNSGRKNEACQDWSKASAIGSAEASQLVQSLCR